MSEQSARQLAIPELSLVVLIGVSGSGKSTFAAQHFKPTEVVSSDVCRGLVADDENDQAATKPAFELLHTIVGIRLREGRLAGAGMSHRVILPMAGRLVSAPLPPLERWHP